jgi:putative ABC transport system ATP-binding protein
MTLSTPPTARPAGTSPLVRLEGVTRSFEEAGGERFVLRGASAELAAGELVVLLGRSGSGKSTLLNLVSGIDLPNAGRIWVDGVEISALGERDRTLFRRRQIGFVFQFFNLLPTLTVEENLLLPLELTGKLAPADRERARALLAEVGLADRAGTFPDRLSGGEQQRVAVARALIHDPLLVLADEPTGNLDLETGLEVIEMLDRLTRRAGKTMLMVTHSREVVGVADRVLTIEDGRLTARAGGRAGAGKDTGKSTGQAAAIPTAPRTSAEPVAP